jgi:hypothetical protein
MARNTSPLRAPVNNSSRIDAAEIWSGQASRVAVRLASSATDKYRVRFVSGFLEIFRHGIFGNHAPLDRQPENRRQACDPPDSL